MDELKRIPFGGNPYADFEFFNLELKVSDIKYSPEQIYAHFEFASGCKVDVQGTFYPSLIRKVVAQICKSQAADIEKLTAKEALRIAGEYSDILEIMSSIQKASSCGLMHIKVDRLINKDGLKLEELGYKITKVTDRHNIYYRISWNEYDN